MINEQRRSVIKKCKSVDGWFSMRESRQDELIEIECKNLGFTLSDFYATDGTVISKLLND